MKLSEQDVTGQVRSYLEIRGWRIVRNQVAMFNSPGGGMVQVGEKGMPDLSAIFYLPNGVALMIWIEMKRPGARSSCRCKPMGSRGARKLCTPCSQERWRFNETTRSGGKAVIVRVDDFEAFECWYHEHYSWLHGPDGLGPLRLEAVR